jgi:sugar lactone lactonase YvrE
MRATPLALFAYRALNCVRVPSLRRRRDAKSVWLAAFVLATSLGGVFAADPIFISTVAGNGVAGRNADGLPARSTALYLPQDGAWGPDGNYYFCDWNNHCIRVYRVAEKIIETVVGTGELGDAQDGSAIGLRLNHPTGISFDLQGHMLIAAWHNSKVKRVDLAAGTVTNIAGTGARAYGGDGEQANLARLDLPSSAVSDSLGNVFISDQANFRIRKLDTNGIITTICGTGVAGYTGDGGLATLATLRSPVGQSAPPAGRIDIDSEDQIYIADTGNHAVRLIDADGVIRTIAGTGQAGYSGDGGPATSARLNTPSDVAVTADGTIYIADTMNNVVRKVAPDGTISTVAGTGVAGFSGDGGLGSDAKLNRPYGVDLGPQGELMISDTHNHRLRLLTVEQGDDVPEEEEPEIEIIACTGEVGSICTYAGTGFSGFNGDGKDRQRTFLYWPFDMEFTPSGRTYVLDWNNHRVRQVLPDGQMVTLVGTDFVGDGPADLSDLSAPGAVGQTVNLNHPTDLQEFPNGDLLIVAWHNHKFRVYDPLTGKVRVILGGPAGFVDGSPARDARVNQPARGVLDPAGNFFFVDQRNQRLRMIRDYANARGDAIVSTIAGTGTLGFNGDGPALQTQVSFPTGTNPEPTGGIARDANGVLYFSDTNNHRIRKLEFRGPDFTDAHITTIAGTGTAGDSGDGGPAIDAQINFPQDVEVGPDGKVYFADTNNNRIRAIDLETGKIEAVAGTGAEGYSGDGGSALAATFNRPFGIAFDPFGNLYISDTFNSRIRKVKLTTTPEGPEPILPEDYRSTFVEVRDCRFSLEHGGVYMRVLASPEAAEAYQNNENPLPVGSVIVKEEFRDDHCDEVEELLRWRVMRKEEPGFDPVDGDWHWQLLTPRREVVEDTKDSCISCHIQPDCVLRDYMCTLPGGVTQLTPILDAMPATLFSISGTPPEDGHAHGHSINFQIFAVGADPGDGRGPFVLNYDGGNWRRLVTGVQGDLWWISDRLIDGAFYICGVNGIILRLDPETKVFQRMQTPGEKLLYGVWGTGVDNLWAVGDGPVNGPDAGGVVWKFNGTEWVDDPTVPEGLPTLYKIWGRSATDVYAVGRQGVIIHYNGVRWRTIQTGVVRPLFTIHGNESRVVATGGAFEGVILELQGASFVDVTPEGAPQINGVYVGPGGLASAVGAEGSNVVSGAHGWELKNPAVAGGPVDFHATWMDSAGGVWAVGGDLTIDKTYGVLAFAGSAAIGREFISDSPCLPSPLARRGTVSYGRDVLPIFREAGCMDVSCHGGPTQEESGYDLRTYESTFGPGVAARNFGMCNIVPGNPDASFLLEKLGPTPRTGVQMPNNVLGPLSEDKIATIRTWIAEGAANDPPALRLSRGDVDASGNLNITDPISTFNYLFVGGTVLACIDAADVNDDNVVNITDGIVSLTFQFLGGVAPSAPFPACGDDPTPDALACESTACN